MYVARLLILELWWVSSVAGFAFAQPALHLFAVTGSAAKPATQRAIVEARSLAALGRGNTRVELKDVIIRGPLDLSYKTINQEVSFVNCEFEDRVDFSYSVFKSHLNLQNSVFKKGLTFEGAIIDLNARLDAIKVVSGDAFFRDI